MLVRQMPHNTEAEQAVLGAMMQCEDKVNDIKLRIKPDDFHHQQHKLMYQAMLSLAQRNIAIDSTTVTSLLSDYNRLEEIGGASYVLAVFESVATLAHTSHYVELMLEKALARHVINQAEKLISNAYEPETTLRDLVTEQKQLFCDIEQNTNQKDNYKKVSEIVSEFTQQINVRAKTNNQITGLRTGFDCIDNKTAGLQKGKLVVIAARPAKGKTVLASNIAHNVCKLNNAHVYLSNLEMDENEIVGRMISASSTITNTQILTGDIKQYDWSEYQRASDELGKLDLYIDDKSHKLETIVSLCRKLKRENKLDLIIIDYLQLVTTSKKSRNRQEEVSKISRELKLLARELNIPVIAVAQLSRDLERRENKRPLLSDLRESGAIEQDADIVLFLYREDYYSAPDAEKTGTTEVIFAKHRGGTTGTVNLKFIGEHTRFENLRYNPKTNRME